MLALRNRSYLLSSLIGIAVIAVISRDYLDLPLWIDELHTSWTLLADWNTVSERALAGNQSPLYFYLLKLVVSVTGQTETSLRVFSTTCACLSVIVLNWLCYRHQLKLLATLLTTVSFAAGHLQLLFAVEARSYSLLTLLILILFCVSSMRWRKTHNAQDEVKKAIGWRLEFTWSLVATLCIYTHYMAIPAIGSLLLAHLFACPAPFVIRMKVFILQVFILGVLIAAQFDTLENIYNHRNQWATFIRAEHATFEALLTKLPVLSTLVLPGICLIVFRPQSMALKPLILGSLILAVVPYLTAWTTTRLDWVNWFFPRYLVTCLPALSLFCGFSVAEIAQSSKSFFTPALVGIGCLLVFVLFDSRAIQNHLEGTITLKNERWDTVAKTLHAKAKPDDIIFLAGGLIEDTRLPKLADAKYTANITTEEYCAFPLNGMYPIPEGLRVQPISDYRQPSLLAQRLKAASKGWLVVRGRGYNQKAEQVLIETFGNDGYKDHMLPGKVNLYFFERLE